ncbi:helix-turn-helix domain-containing protein [Nonomuraea typhae]|uniref:Helix-turn-helix domain-containing protein n=1 Tax=Nonomuraea typhae TaxID=2603600 RepID=A0ABW7ZB29_9ACTN
MDSVELVMHPVRLRIIHAFSLHALLTTADLCERLPDVSKATIYRHVGYLVDGGILEAAGEQRVHSVLERRYRLVGQQAAIDREQAAALTHDDHRRLFGVATAALLAEFNAYLDREDSDPIADRAIYPQTTLWLDPGELANLITNLRELIRPLAENAPSDGRAPYFFNSVLFPGQPLP